MGQKQSRRCGDAVCAAATTECPYTCDACAGRPPARIGKRILAVSNCQYIGCRPRQRVCEPRMIYCNNSTECTVCGRYSRQVFVCRRVRTTTDEAVTESPAAAAEAESPAASAVAENSGRVVPSSSCTDVSADRPARNGDTCRPTGPQREPDDDGEKAQEDRCDVGADRTTTGRTSLEDVEKLISAVSQQLKLLEDSQMLSKQKSWLKRDYTYVKNELIDLQEKLTQEKKLEEKCIQKWFECLQSSFVFLKDKHCQSIRFYKYSGLKYLQSFRNAV